jgi:integrase
MATALKLKEERPPKPSKLLDLKQVKLWHDNLMQDSEVTARNYLSWLNIYCRKRELDPLQLIEEAKEDFKKCQDELQDYINNLRRKDTGNQMTPKSKGLALSAVKSWFNSNEIEIKRDIRIGNTNSTPTLDNEIPPTQEELDRILDYAPNNRTKAIITLIAFVGIRPRAISKLKISDLVEFKFDNDAKRVTVENIPARINIRAELSKNHRPYFTYMIEQGCHYLKEYLEERMRTHYDPLIKKRIEGELLMPDSPVIGKAKTFRHWSIYLTAGDVSKAIRTTFGKANFKQRPYVLRSYYDSAMNAQGFNHNYQKFLMGHKGDIEGVYTTNKKRLPDHVIEEMRQMFVELAAPKLSTKYPQSPIKSQEMQQELELIRFETKVDTYHAVGQLKNSPEDYVREKATEKYFEQLELPFDSRNEKVLGSNARLSRF